MMRSRCLWLIQSCCLQMVELASEKFVCIVDDTKLVEGIGGSKGAQPSAQLICHPWHGSAKGNIAERVHQMTCSIQFVVTKGSPAIRMLAPCSNIA